MEPHITHCPSSIPVFVMETCQILSSGRRRLLAHHGSSRAFISSLKACAKKKDPYTGVLLHDAILKRGLLLKNAYLGSSLISMYAKCGMLDRAREVLEGLPDRDMVCWSTLISGYAQHGRGHDALACFDRMQSDGFDADVVTFVCVLKACGCVKAIGKGERIHEGIVNRGLLKKDVVLGTALIDMYAKCGLLVRSRRVLEELLLRNVACWNALISGYVQREEYHDALNCFEQMQCEGLSPNVVTFTCVLKACGHIGAVDQGSDVHIEISNKGLLEKDVVLGTALADMYVKCGLLEKAQGVLEEISIRDVVAWNVLLVGYAQHGQNDETLACFERMRNEGLCPDVTTFLCILKACGGIRAIDKGKQTHDEILRKGFLPKDVSLGAALVDMYSKCGLLERARELLDELPLRNVVTWNALISGYAHQAQYHEALCSFYRMQSEGISPDQFTCTCILKACYSVGAVVEGQKIHDEVLLSKDLDRKDTMLLSTELLNMYAKCGMLAKAQQLFEDLPIRDAVSWSMLIAGYTQQGQYHEALNCFERMQSEGLPPDEVILTCALNACGCVGAVDKGMLVHEEIMSKGLLEKHIALGNALVDMYAKCGVLVKTKQVLEQIPVRDVVAWSALIAGYAHQGSSYEALKHFERMQSEGIAPNEITFLSVLNACSHSGLADEAQALLDIMTREHKITPTVEHHTCLVVVFGGAGMFDKAIAVIQSMPSLDSPDIWVALLGTCRKWGNVRLAKLAFDQVLQIDDHACPAVYAHMSNIFMDSGFPEDAEKTEEKRLKYCDY